MKKRFSGLVLVLVAFVLTWSTVGCSVPSSSKDSSTPAASTPAFTTAQMATVIPVITTNPAATAQSNSSLPAAVIMTSGTKQYGEYSGSGSFEADLDMDGKKDTVQFKFKDSNDKDLPQGANALDQSKTNYEVRELSLTINGESLDVTGELLTGTILVVDTDSSDKSIELAVSEWGPSDDPLTTFVTLQDGSPQVVGAATGNPYGKMKIDGSGIIKTINRGYILHTWYYDAAYAYQDGVIEQVEADKYPMNTKVKALVEVHLSDEPDGTLTTTLKPGEEATIEYTNDVDWCYVTTADGRKGFLKVDDGCNIDGRYAGEVFDGLTFAD